MKRRPLTRAFSAAVATVLISSGLLVGAAATAQAEPEPPQDKDLLECVLSLELANCLTGDSELLGTGVVGQPLELVQPVFGFLPANLLGLVETDITWLCDGVEIPGTEGLTELVPTEALVGCQVAVQTVTTLLGFLPLTLVTDLIGITGEGEEEPDLPGSLLEVLTSPPTLSGSGDIGDPLTLTGPVFDLVPALLGLLGTDITWLCDGVEIPGTEGLTQFTPTDLQAGCEIAVKTVSTLLSLLPLELLTNVIPVDEEDPEDPPLTAQVSPTIAGAKRVGGVLDINPGTWLGGLELVEPLFEYQWYTTKGAIPGADTKQYVPKLADAGGYLAATVTAVLPGFLDGLGITNVVKVAKLGSKTKLRKAGPRVVALRVIPGVARPTGKVRLMTGTRVLRTVRLQAADNGRRTVKLPMLAKGTHRVRAVYQGSKSLKKSRSQVLRLTLR